MGKVKYLVAILILTGCNSPDCPLFPEEGLGWMPYEKGDTISFSDGIDTFQLNVNETDRTSYSYRKPFSSHANCEAHALAKLSGNSSLPRFNITGTSFPPDLLRSYTVSFNDSVNFMFTINNSGVLVYYNYRPTCESITKFNNGLNEYADVVKVSYDTLSYSETPVYQVFMANKYGVIQFKERYNHKTWSMIRR